MAASGVSGEGRGIFIPASDGLRLHVREYRSAAGIAVVCLPGLARTTADFDALAAARQRRLGADLRCAIGAHACRIRRRAPAAAAMGAIRRARACAGAGDPRRQFRHSFASDRNRDACAPSGFRMHRGGSDGAMAMRKISKADAHYSIGHKDSHCGKSRLTATKDTAGILLRHCHRRLN
jgi:hypothetical protein